MGYRQVGKAQDSDSCIAKVRVLLSQPRKKVDFDRKSTFFSSEYVLQTNLEYVIIPSKEYLGVFCVKTGMRTDIYYINGTDKTDYERMKSHGYDCADLQIVADINHELFSATEERLKEICIEEKEQANKAEIEFCQAHGPWPVNDKTEENRIKNLEYFKTAVRACNYMGIEYLVVHPLMPYGWGEEENPSRVEELNEKFIREICDYAEPFGVTICFENLIVTHHIMHSVEKTVEFVNRLNLPNLRICLDTGHANLFGGDIGDMVRLCGDKLVSLHVHDNKGTKDEHNMPYFGTINWDSFKQAIKDVGYKGCMTLESNIPNFPEDIKEYMLTGMGKVAKYLADI